MSTLNLAIDIVKTIYAVAVRLIACIYFLFFSVILVINYTVQLIQKCSINRLPSKIIDAYNIIIGIDIIWLLEIVTAANVLSPAVSYLYNL